jgi:hypothetical protein
MNYDFEDRVEVTTEMLRGAARDAGMTISGDDRVSESDAETLLGLCERTLRRYREENRAPSFHRISNRITYRIESLARFIEQGFEPRR